MSATDGKTSPASDFIRETMHFDLPRPVGGKVLTVEFGTISGVDFVTAMQGVPELNLAPAAGPTSAEAAGKSWAELREKVLESEGPVRRVLELAMVSPLFTFDSPPEAGKAPWRSLHKDNQEALLAEIMDFSALMKKPASAATTPATPAEAATASAESFRGVAPE